MWFGEGLGRQVEQVAQEDCDNKVEVCGPRTRASCRTCDERIEPDSLRVKRGGAFFHLRCFKPTLNGRAPLGPNYWLMLGEFSDEHRATLNAWTEKWNAVHRRNATPAVPEGKVVDVQHVAAAPQLDTPDGAREGFAILATDTITHLFSFLTSERHLASVRRVCKSFMRATEGIYRRRFMAHNADAPLPEPLTASWYAMYTHQCCHCCHRHMAPGTAALIAVLRRYVCRACLATPSYQMTARKYLTAYGLTEADIAKYRIPFEKRPNPHGRALAPMKVFLVLHLEEAARRKATGVADPVVSPKRKKKKE